MDGECVQRKISDILTSSLAFKRSVVYLHRKIPNQILQPIQIPCLLTASKVVAWITIHFHCSLLPTVFVFSLRLKFVSAISGKVSWKITHELKVRGNQNTRSSQSPLSLLSQAIGLNHQVCKKSLSHSATLIKRSTKGLANFVRYNEVLGSFPYTYFTITGINKSVRFTEDFIVIILQSVPLLLLLTNLRVIGSVVKPCCQFFI